MLEVNASLAKELFTNLEARKEELIKEWREFYGHLMEDTTADPLVATEDAADVSLASKIP